MLIEYRLKISCTLNCTAVCRVTRHAFCEDREEVVVVVVVVGGEGDTLDTM